MVRRLPPSLVRFIYVKCGWFVFRVRDLDPSVFVVGVVRYYFVSCVVRCFAKRLFFLLCLVWGVELGPLSRRAAFGKLCFF